jgi:hypothetical protein
LAAAAFGRSVIVVFATLSVRPAGVCLLGPAVARVRGADR